MEPNPASSATPPAAPATAKGSNAQPPGGSPAQLRRIGWLLAWAVVFCDIGTSVYYVPGILYHHVGNLAPYFVLLTTLGFLLLAQKYTEVAGDNPEGGGVVTVARKAFGSWWGALGGILITIDYFLTSAISSVSGFAYLSSVLPGLEAHVVLLACSGLVLLCLLNIIGIRESATVALVMASASFLVNLVVVIVSGARLTGADVAIIRDAWGDFSRLPLRELLIGFAGSWLAFSGLESISQLSPALKAPIHKTVRYAMFLVIASVILTSPTLTALSVAAIPADIKATQSEAFISQLAAARAGPWMQISVVATASALLLFAANTAMIGGYHVFLALSRDRFFPRLLARRNVMFSTPHWAIGLATLVPVVTILGTAGNLTILGDMYSFGLLGAFTFTALGLDVIRWRKNRRGWLFWIGLLTTTIVSASWVINIIEKPLATIYGGGLLILGLFFALSVRRDWIVHALNRFPPIARRAVLLRARTELQIEEENEILSLASAVALKSLYPSHTLVATTNYNPKLLDEAIRRVQGEGQHSLFLMSVTEWPGLFSGAETRPSSDAVSYSHLTL
ncbi:MAG: APC family permease, partial [Candidatus Eisenbacteria bacterium]|nr:APC family permease [Candidatus Eisenbacteria bacterium]